MEILQMKKNNNPGKLITFCGLDGCGKTTLINMLANQLMLEGEEIILTKQPTKAARNNEIFRTFMDCEDNSAFAYRSLSLMMAADRIQHVNKYFEPELKKGKTIISDRYFYSCLANLRARGYINDQWIYEVAQWIVEPDFAIFLDVNVETAISRVRERKSEKNRYIDLELQYKLREEYLAIAELNNYPVINTSEAIEDSYNVLKKIIYGASFWNKDIENKIEKIICKCSIVPVEGVNNYTSLDDLGYDSLSKTQLIIELENLIEKEIPLEFINPNNMVNVESIKRMIKDAL